MTPKTESSPADLIRFRWRRMEEARWVDADGRRVLAGWNASEWYDPLRSEPALFEEFARLPDEPEAFARFAAAFGDLGAAPPTVAPRGHIDGLGHSFEYWSGQRRLIGFAVDLWDAIEEDRSEELVGHDLVVEDLAEGWSERLEGSSQGRRFAATVTAPIQQAVRDVRQEGHGAEDRDAAPSEVDSAAVAAWRDRVDGTVAFLENRDISPKAVAAMALAQFVTDNCRDLSVAMMVTTAPGAPLRMTFQVESLIAAMWLQLARAIDGKRKYRTCPVCGRWWDATAARSDKLTCSDRCRKSRQRAKTTADAKEAE